MNKVVLIVIIIVLMAFDMSCAEQKDSGKPKANKEQQSSKEYEGTSQNSVIAGLSFSVVRELMHDNQAYTQGLYYLNGFLYESTGQYRKSSLRKIDAVTGKIITIEKVDNSYFAEGLTIFKNKIYQLTWMSNTGFIYDLKSMNQIGSFNYYGEGWGITNDENNLIMSDGTNGLRFLNPSNFTVEKTIFVTDENSYPVSNLNELEMVNGEIWANVWMKDVIVRINPQTGKINAKLDFSDLRNRLTIDANTDVLNGIAYDKKNDEYYITGKNWNKIFVVKIK